MFYKFSKYLNCGKIYWEILFGNIKIKYVFLSLHSISSIFAGVFY